jgi:hypothetical protein
MERLNILTKTKTSTYMLPCLGINIVPYKSSIVNAFIGDDDYPKLDSHLFVLYRFSGDRKFIEFEDDLEENPLYVMSYDPEKEFVMKVFKIPENFKKDLDTFKNSKYSELTLDLKTKIVAFHNLSPEHPLIDVLYKREAAFERLEAELNKYPGVSEIKVDRNLEASGLLDMTREVYSSRYKTNSDFLTAENNFMKEGLK